jgi:hypothetical protein
LKRLIGKSVVAVLLSGGAMVVAASPSSAARDNKCIDAQHYAQAVQNMTDSYVDAAAVLADWQNAYYYKDPLTGFEVWQANVWGVTHQVYFLSDYNAQVGAAQLTANQMQGQLEYFVDNFNIC